MKNEMKMKRKNFSVSNVILFGVLTIYSLSLLVLLLWGASTSVKTIDDFYYNPIWLPSGAPSEWAWDNYSYVFQKFSVRTKDTLGRIISVNILGQTINTILYTIVGSFLTTIACCVVSYCASKYNYFFSKILYTIVLTVMIIPIVGNTPSMLLLLNASCPKSKLGSLLTFLNLIFFSEKPTV